MSIPDLSTPIPARVLELAGGARLTPVWLNGVGALTVATDDHRYIKYGPYDAESSVADQVMRLRWARPYLLVPEVLESGEEAGQEWLVTRAIPGRSAVDEPWIDRPAVAVRAVGMALRAMHDRLPVESCPFDWSVAARIEAAADRGITVPERLREAPSIDRLVVCHGDACVPNTLLADDGTWLAHVDLGGLGVADRWADIAVAAMSTEWNYGPGWEDALIEAYGVAPDRERLAYYRDLWNAT